MIDVQFNGVWLSNYAKIMDVRRDILAPRSLRTVTVPGRDGAYLFGKRSEPRVFEIDIMFIDDIENKRSQLAEILDTETAVPIEFSDKPGIEYFGIVTAESEMKIRQHTATATLQFFVPEPFGYGASYLIDLPAANSSGVVEVEAFGDAPVYPEIRATFNQSSAAFALANGSDDYLQLGYFQQVEQTPLPAEQLVWSDGAETLTGWSALSGSFNENVLTGAIASNNYAFYLSNPGTGTAWHGGAITRSFGTTYTDFLFQARVINTADGLSDIVKRMGKIDIYLRNAAGEDIIKMTIKDDRAGANIGTAQVAIGAYGNRTVLLDNTSLDLRYFSGNIRLRRKGNVFTFQFQQVRNGQVSWTVGDRFVDAYGLADDPIASVVVAISAHGTDPVSTMFVEAMWLYKLNELNPVTQSDQPFSAGDELVVKMATGEVYLNGINRIDLMIPGSKFFALHEGVNAIGVSPPGIANIRITYRSRWR